MARASTTTRARSHKTYKSAKSNDGWGSYTFSGYKSTVGSAGRRVKKTTKYSMATEVKAQNKYFKERAKQALELYKRTGYEPAYTEYLGWKELIDHNENFRRKVVLSGDNRKKYVARYGKN